MKPETMHFRQHWIVLVTKPLLYSLAVFAFAWYIYAHIILLRGLGSALHFGPQEARGIMVKVMLATLAATVLVLAASFLNWWYTYLEIDGHSFIWRLSIFRENRVPLDAIQDIQKNVGFLGSILGFGTLLVDAGKETEVFRYVPDVSSVVDNLDAQAWRDAKWERRRQEDHEDMERLHEEFEGNRQAASRGY